MGEPADAGPGSSLPEEGVAAAETLLVMTAAIGGQSALVAAAANEPPIVAGPAVLLLAALLATAVGAPREGSIPTAGWYGAAVWLVLVPTAPDLGALVSLSMAAACLALAVGPSRLVALLVADLVRRATLEPHAGGEAGATVPEGWIEDADERPAGRSAPLRLRPRSGGSRRPYGPRRPLSSTSSTR